MESRCHKHKTQTAPTGPYPRGVLLHLRVVSAMTAAGTQRRESSAADRKPSRQLAIGPVVLAGAGFTIGRAAGRSRSDGFQIDPSGSRRVRRLM
ncbi:hypothetical protein FTUN_8563 [Frigoriglobus tundricola]|uniref:Uncharacterized protein n=1 Tax=Frigoriglobus tundricola TaxID=2774151 RepID=A0A6M5Z5E9_9BACT|nr:hypothetical protein FTUN_8563 [Frigoriglobus tundricola]